MKDHEAGGQPVRSSDRGGASGSGGPSAASWAGLGLQLLASILVCLYAGQWLDRRFGTKGIWTVAGVLLGAGAAIFSAYRRLVAEQRRDEHRRRDAGGR